MATPIQLSATVITYNEERHIARCLDSLIPVADEIVVVDSLSTDRTKQICLSRGVTFVEQPFLGYVEQKNFVLDRATHEHVLHLDADECLSGDLQQAILAVKQDWRGDGFTMNRANNFYGRWLRHGEGYPDRKLRLWRRGRGRWGGLNPHDKVVMQDGCVVTRLAGDLLHYNYGSIDAHARQIDHFSSIAARAYLDAGRRSSPAKVVLRPLGRFLHGYILRRGFLDGYPGLVVCLMQAYQTFLKYAKLFELQQAAERQAR